MKLKMNLPRKGKRKMIGGRLYLGASFPWRAYVQTHRHAATPYICNPLGIPPPPHFPLHGGIYPRTRCDGGQAETRRRGRALLMCDNPGQAWVPLVPPQIAGSLTSPTPVSISLEFEYSAGGKQFDKWMKRFTNKERMRR